MEISFLVKAILPHAEEHTKVYALVSKSNTPGRYLINQVYFRIDNHLTPFMTPFFLQKIKKDTSFEWIHENFKRPSAIGNAIGQALDAQLSK